MIIAVVSCWKYRDAWGPFFSLLDKFWPDHPEAVLLTDDYDTAPDVPARVRIVSGPRSAHWNWCQVVANFAAMVEADQRILLMQEDFFIHTPVETALVEHGLAEMARLGAMAVRLYPCPGADEDYGDAYYGRVSWTARYRVSCQATIWQPDFLRYVAAGAAGSPSDFELEGTRLSQTVESSVLAFKRDVTPWPIQYLCSGIARGQWNPDSKRLFDKHGIVADYSLREMATA